MPKQTRWAIKQDLDNAIGNIESAQGKIAKTGQRFEGVHDELYNACLAIFASLEAILLSIRRLKDVI